MLFISLQLVPLPYPAGFFIKPLHFFLRMIRMIFARFILSEPKRRIQSVAGWPANLVAMSHSGAASSRQRDLAEQRPGSENENYGWTDG